MKTQAKDRHSSLLIDLSFQGVDRRFILSFENGYDRRSYNRYYLPVVAKWKIVTSGFKTGIMPK